MPLSYGPPSAAVANTSALTKGQVTAVGPLDLTVVDPSGANVNSYVAVNTMFNAAHTGAQFTAIMLGNGHRVQFQVKPFGSGGLWRPTAAMDMASGYWDSDHRTYDSGGTYTWVVPTYGAVDVRMVRMAGPAGTNTCMASALASHNAMPPPPRYVGKRDVTLMVKNYNTAVTVYTLAQFDFTQANDDRTSTYTTAVTSRAVRTGRRLWVQGYDASYSPQGATDRARVVLVSRPNGAVSSAAGALTNGTIPSFDIAVNTAPGRAVMLPEPLEFQNSLGAGSPMNVGIAAWATVGVGNLNVTLFCFETL